MSSPIRAESTHQRADDVLEVRVEQRGLLLVPLKHIGDPLEGAPLGAGSGGSAVSAQTVAVTSA
eukprot:CAMPEP_0180043950 /NCGR_PEP_ID=MMETSP0984-20121128/35668_1 /TAXON_ID=483367 /ORGANISM="non described non described, Strain CCMP 2436" /LENGTH=63 /DNA_ID=CAMNT_0021972095 /DNA_START=522 /DNA_END=710 /DNA_ORIENTATION=+